MIAQALVMMALVLNGGPGGTLIPEFKLDDPIAMPLRPMTPRHPPAEAPEKLPRPAPPLDVDWLTPEPPQKLKVLLVRFWNVGCDTCVATLPELDILQRRYRKRGLVVVGIHMSEKAEDEDQRIQNVLDEEKITFAIGQDRKGKALKEWWLFRERPTRSCTALVDSRGRIRWLRASTDREKPKWESDLKDLEAALKQLLAER